MPSFRSTLLVTSLSLRSMRYACFVILGLLRALCNVSFIACNIVSNVMRLVRCVLQVSRFALSTVRYNSCVQYCVLRTLSCIICISRVVLSSVYCTRRDAFLRFSC